jgi:hypothetical protein
MLLTHLYFGAGFPAYRRGLMTELGQKKWPEQYVWEIGPGRGSREILDLFHGDWSEERGTLKVGQVVHRLFVALTSDFYRPFRLASLHFLLYPEEYFNPFSSPGRVHRALGRFREWCRSEGAPFVISESHGGYRLGAMGPAGVLLWRTEPVTDPTRNALERLREKYASRSFWAKDAVRLLGTSRSAVQRLLKEGELAGQLEKIGHGTATRYRFAA